MTAHAILHKEELHNKTGLRGQFIPTHLPIHIYNEHNMYYEISTVCKNYTWM
jgi:hypothetical protein